MEKLGKYKVNNKIFDVFWSNKKKDEEFIKNYKIEEGIALFNESIEKLLYEILKNSEEFLKKIDTDKILIILEEETKPKFSTSHKKRLHLSRKYKAKIGEIKNGY